VAKRKRGVRRRRSQSTNATEAARGAAYQGSFYRDGTQHTAQLDPSDIPALEEALGREAFDEASARVLALIEALGSDGADVDLGTDDEAQIRSGFGRVVRAIAALIAAPRFVPSSEFFRGLALRKRVLMDLFAASDLGGMDPMLAAVAAGLERRGDSDVTALKKLLLCYSIESSFDIDLARYLSEARDVVLDAYVGLLATSVVLTERGQATRERLSALAAAVGGYPLPFGSLRFLAQAWFRCSYDDVPGKHAVKPHLNAIVRRTLANVGVTDLKPSREAREGRPTMALALERFTSTHAVYRCWAPAVRQLRERFRLVAVCERGRVDERSAALFDDVLTFGFSEGDLRRGVAAIEQLGPDLLFYPSVGMSASMIALANLRLAPIQVMTVGHPATTASAVMDYVVVEEPWLGDPSLFTETVLLLEEGGFQAEKRHDALPVEPTIRESADPVRVAVSGTFFKLNPRFLGVCREIRARSHRNVEFHFFPSTLGPRHHHVRRRIREAVPGAIVYPSTSYNEYVMNLNRCDVQLVPFPFGNTNSSLDGFRQGIPVVTMDGSEVHSRIDGAMLRSLGLPDWLVAEDTEGFVSAALRLIDSDEERLTISRMMLASNLDRRFFDSDFEHHPRDFVELFWWLYRFHEEIRADGRKVWTPDGRRDVQLRANGGGGHERAASDVECIRVGLENEFLATGG
jgi:hypothetical protein